jgi:hypothetical protein
MAAIPKMAVIYLLAVLITNEYIHQLHLVFHISTLTTGINKILLPERQKKKTCSYMAFFLR